MDRAGRSDAELEKGAEMIDKINKFINRWEWLIAPVLGLAGAVICAIGMATK